MMNHPISIHQMSRRVMLCLSCFLATSAPAAVTGRMPDDRGARRTRMTTPDYSHVKTLAAAKALAKEGKLTGILLFPAELGGEDVSQNTVYVSPQAAEARDLVVGTLRRFVREGLIDRLEVTPDYNGDSIIPSRIVFHATDSHGKYGAFDPTIEIW
jgi:hypothetical protein